MKKVQLILIIVGGLILIGLAFSFSYWQKQLKPKEISREEAIEIALEKYPGEIKNIIREDAISERNIVGSAFWLVEIALEEPIFFEKVNKEIRIIQVKVTADKKVDIYEIVE